MSTFREFATKAIEEGIADLQSHGETTDPWGVLAGAMVDAATIAVQEWFRSELFEVQYVVLSHADPEVIIAELIREAGKVTP